MRDEEEAGSFFNSKEKDDTDIEILNGHIFNQKKLHFEYFLEIILSIA